VQVEIPLYTGGRSTASAPRRRAELTRSEAELARAELELRQGAQSLWEEIEVLRASRDEARTRVDYRELYLDRSRTLYEMEGTRIWATPWWCRRRHACARLNSSTNCC